MTTTIADVMIIYATLPFVAAAIGWLVNREAVSARTLVAGTIAFAGMVVLQRRRPGASIIAVNAIGAFGSGLVGFALSPHPALGLYDMGVLFLFGLTTIGLAFVLFMEGAKFIPSAEAGLISLLDVVLGPVWVFRALGENPGWPTALGGAIVLGAALWRLAPDHSGDALW